MKRGNVVIYRGKMGQVDRTWREVNKNIKTKIAKYSQLSIKYRPYLSATDIKHSIVKAYILKPITEAYPTKTWKRQHWTERKKRQHWAERIQRRVK